MKAWVRVTLVVAATQFATADETPAPVPSADPRIAALLKSLDYPYDLTEDKDYKLVFEVGDDKRTQMVVVNSNTESYDKAEIRELWSPALLVNGPLDAALAERLLRANDTFKLGAWRAWPADKKGESEQIYIVFAAQIDANASPDVLAAALNVVSQTADALEKEIAHIDER